MKLSNTSEELLANAIKAQASEGFATALAAWLKAVFQYDNITVIAYFSAAPPDLLIANAEQDSVHANFDRIYSAGAYLLDPFYDLHTSAVPSGVYRLSEIAPDQFRRHRYFLDYYQATTMVDEFAFVAYPAPGKSVHVCLGRDSTSNTKFSARDLKRAKQMLPVVLALVEKEWAKSDKPGIHSDDNITERLITAVNTPPAESRWLRVTAKSRIGPPFGGLRSR